VVDGDLRMWLEVPPRQTIVVLDYRGAPYLRFTPEGVQVNQNSAMFYLNMTPVAQTPPANLSAHTAPRWVHVSGAHAYEWHDGRLHALASVALAPGQSYVGRWTIPLLVDGRPRLLAGGVWHAAAPSVVWFWPVVVMLACLLAALRLRDPGLDARIAAALAGSALVVITIIGAGRGLHGRPAVTPFQLVELAAILAFAVWAVVRLLSRRTGYFTYFLIAFLALLEGAEAFTTLVYGFVLIPLPGFVARAATVLCLGSGAGLMLLVFRLAGRSETPPRGRRGEASQAPAGEDDDAWELA
jgi:hypothetical protein